MLDYSYAGFGPKISLPKVTRFKVHVIDFMKLISLHLGAKSY
jgi:hypothetical protein